MAASSAPLVVVLSGLLFGFNTFDDVGQPARWEAEAGVEAEAVAAIDASDADTLEDEKAAVHRPLALPPAAAPRLNALPPAAAPKPNSLVPAAAPKLNAMAPAVAPRPDAMPPATEPTSNAIPPVAALPGEGTVSTEPAEEVRRELPEGTASYYGHELAGRPTASGERFDPEGFTAAHPKLPFGTRLRVTNIRNGKSVVVRVNDRGPFTGNRVLDLSFSAAREIGMIRRGLARVRIEVLK